MEKKEKKIPLINWQPPMVKVLYALIPLVLASVYFFGWRCLLVIGTVNLAGFLMEYLFVRNWKEPVSAAVFVTSTLLALSLPPSIPLWMAVVGIVFGVVFGKMVFGGFGKNIFNPALTGRAFLYVSFAIPMTGKWNEPASGIPGGFAKFTTDAVTSATPMAAIKAGNAAPPFLSLLLGNTAGSMGETCALLIILGGLYLIWKKAANFRIVLGCFIGMMLLQGTFWLMHIRHAPDPLTTFLAGSVAFGLFFFTTDPISAAQTDEGRWIYGFVIGILTVIIRNFSAWPEGMMFAILLGNMFAPITDYYIREFKARKKKVVAAA
ncbi:MAG: RnfABCDGE type electron transport complex subunit D [Firmicutes bacterium]|nr:RnfABCDGE type electron transport complex subunit D [Bacillota bacterium]